MNEFLIGCSIAFPLGYVASSYTWPWIHAKFIAAKTISSKIRADL